ncbi:keratin, type II cytoskeletal 2 epidermal-like [Colias croceus]|uniref:keratin, type II cytoskeletal 2 epidermal-like n=1 Tax=Colias crocea TaxID=72248 RepID=UPI001E27C8DA|nr:keratin, type II cytoskeletal 2 epidermal-like [Colias croceus]
MSRLNLICVLILVVLGISHAARIARSPQFGGASASAQAGAFGGNRFNPGPSRPGFGQGGFGQGGFGQRGFGQRGFGQGGFGQGGFGRPGFNRPGGGPSISIAKSVSISAGRGGAQSSSSANSFGK